MNKMSYIGKKISGKMKSRDLKSDEAMSSDDIQYNEDNRLAHKMEQGGLARNGSAHWIDELIQYSTRFTNELEKLRALFNAAKVEPRLDLANKALIELSDIVRAVLQKHPALKHTDILAASSNLTSLLAGYGSDDNVQCGEDVLFTVDQLALAFTDSISQYIRDEQQALEGSTLKKVQSSDSLQSGMDNHSRPGDILPAFGNEEADEVLYKAVHGVDLALNRAKLWTKYTKDITVYMDKRTSYVCEFAKKISQLSTASKPLFMEESYLPFQSIFCTALDQDIDMSASIQAATVEIIQQRIINRLSDRRTEHDRVRRLLRDEWTREQKKLEDSVLNLKKTKTLFIQRQTEYEKVKESNQRMDSEASSGQQSVSSSKADKKKKLEDDACFKTMEAENAYRMAIVDVKQRKEDADRTKGDLVVKIRKLLEDSDRILQKVVTEYFQVLQSLAVAQPVQLLTLAESSEHYEPAGQYLAYIRSVAQSLDTGNSSSTPTQHHTDRPSSMVNLNRTPVAGLDDVRDVDSPVSSIHKSLMSRRDGHVGSVEDEGESGSLASWQSISSTPSGSPQQSRRQLPRSSDHGDADRDTDTGVEVPEDVSHQTQSINQVVLTHAFQRVIIPTTCKLCGSLVIRGVYCSKCGLSAHKRCLDVLKLECGGRNMDSQSTVTSISFMVQRCISEIDKRGLELKGIYRTSGAKLKVEELTKSFEQGRVAEDADLGEHHPNVIASVLKQSLRELPEPLLTYQLYPTVIKLMKAERGVDGLEKKTEAELVAELKQLLRSSVPLVSWHLCKVLHHHLKRVSDKMEVNQMTASNLGIVFGPTLLRSSDVATTESLLDTQYQARAVELMIKHCEDIFGAESDLAGVAEQSLDSQLCETNSWDVPEITVNLLAELTLEEPRFQKLSDQVSSGSASSNSSAPVSSTQPPSYSLPTLPSEGQSSLTLTARKQSLAATYSAPVGVSAPRQLPSNALLSLSDQPPTTSVDSKQLSTSNSNDSVGSAAVDSEHIPHQHSDESRPHSSKSGYKHTHSTHARHLPHQHSDKLKYHSSEHGHGHHRHVPHQHSDEQRHHSSEHGHGHLCYHSDDEEQPHSPRHQNALTRKPAMYHDHHQSHGAVSVEQQQSNATGSSSEVEVERRAAHKPTVKCKSIYRYIVNRNSASPMVQQHDSSAETVSGEVGSTSLPSHSLSHADTGRRGCDNGAESPSESCADKPADSTS